MHLIDFCCFFQSPTKISLVSFYKNLLAAPLEHLMTSLTSLEYLLTFSALVEHLLIFSAPVEHLITCWAPHDFFSTSWASLDLSAPLEHLVTSLAPLEQEVLSSLELFVLDIYLYTYLYLYTRHSWKSLKFSIIRMPKS